MDRVSDTKSRLVSNLKRAGRSVFGDRVGLVLFLGATAFFMVYWRIGFFISDNYAVANSVLNLADGHLDIKRIAYGMSPQAQPGIHRVDGKIYARNYGHIVLSLPFFFVLDWLSGVFDLRVLIAAVWSFLLLVLGNQIGELSGLKDELTIAASFLAFAGFFVNVLFGTDLDPDWIAMMSLQLSTMVAAGLIGVFFYRLFKRIYGSHVGVFAGSVAVLATPISFWASIPKRHVIISFLLVLVLYTFYVSRESGSLTHRALMYGFIGLASWIHAFEAMVLFVAVIPVDLLTAKKNSLRRIGVISLVFGLSLIPFILTNYVISGDPLKPPRMLSRSTANIDLISGGDYPGSDPGQSTATSGSGSGQPTDTVSPDSSQSTNTADSTQSGKTEGSKSDSNGGTDILAKIINPLLSSPLAETVFDVVEDIAKVSLTFWSIITDGFNIVVKKPERLYYTFVRSGRIPMGVAYNYNQNEAVELTVLESMPILGVLLSLPVVAYHRLKLLLKGIESIDLNPRRFRAETKTDLMVAVFILIFTVGYMTRLPLHAQITVRYLLPIYPALLYFVVRVPAVNQAVNSQGKVFALSYSSFLVISVGGILSLFEAMEPEPAIGEAVQFHALLSLAVAGVTGVVIIGDTVSDRIGSRLVSVALALSAAVTTAFWLLSGVGYFTYGEYALDAVGVVSELIKVS